MSEDRVTVEDMHRRVMRVMATTAAILPPSRVPSDLREAHVTAMARAAPVRGTERLRDQLYRRAPQLDTESDGSTSSSSTMSKSSLDCVRDT